MNSLAKTVRALLEEQPYVNHALKQGVVNYTALAKQLVPKVKKELGRAPSVDSIAVTIRRYAEDLQKNSLSAEKELVKLLEKSHINLKNGIADVTFKKGELRVNGVTPLHTMSGSNADMLIVNQEDLEKIDTSNAVEIRKNLVEINIITGPEVESLPGFVHYVSGLLASNGINLVECISFYTDTIFILEEKDATKAYEILREKTKSKQSANIQKSGDR